MSILREAYERKLAAASPLTDAELRTALVSALERLTQQDTQ